MEYISKVTVLSAVLLSGCASNPDKIDAAYVSPLKYSKYDCDQLSMELDYIGNRTTKLYNQLKKEQTSDQWQMGLGMVLFWPALFALEGGDGPSAAEYSQLKGEYEAVRQSVVKKKCGYETTSPDEIIKTASEKDKAADAD
tara:strand:+ start:324 stop:746 length:423 start_codon:yes stop_codon:yes gene_type:complete